MAHPKGLTAVALLCLCYAATSPGIEIPGPRDISYVGTVTLSVDLTDLDRRLFKVRETVPVKPGRLTLLYPQWLPGMHAPLGPVDLLTGLIVTARGKRVEWVRDPVNVYAFHVQVPAGTDRLELEFQFTSPQTGTQGRIVATPEMLGLQWHTVLLYPAGYHARRIAVRPDVTLPGDWEFATALSIAARDANRVQFETTTLEALVDSPLLAGRHYQRLDLDPGADVPVYANVVADSPANLDIKPEQLAAYRKLMKEAYALFGTRAFDRYDFLLALTENLGRIGLEHHRSSENVHRPGHFTEWDKNIPGRDLLPHELVHSWNGKHRRPADLWTPNFNVPMQNSLLWVYEGQTQYWGIVLSARSGLWSQDVARQVLANIAATYDRNRPGRAWRNLQDTTNEPILTQRRPPPFPSWQRTEDYYNEGVLLWLDVDTTLRERNQDRRSLDDFARGFFGTRDKSYDVRTYTLDDVAFALDSVSRHDWKSFLKERLERHGPGAPLNGLSRSGWKLVFREEQPAYLKALDDVNMALNLGFSLGLAVSTKDKGDITEVVWDSPAFRAGLTTASKLIAVNGREFAPDVLLQAIRAAKKTRQPIELLVKTFDRYRTVQVPYFEGLQYPYLERTEGTPDRLTAILGSRS